MNGLRQLICFLTTLSILLWLTPTRLSAQSEECRFLVSPQEFNTSEENDRVVIGQIRGRPYTVLLNYEIQSNLPLIRACIPDAFLTSSRRGPYIHIASFDTYRDARDLADVISNSLNIDIRVIHRNRLRR